MKTSTKIAVILLHIFICSGTNSKSSPLDANFPPSPPPQQCDTVITLQSQAEVDAYWQVYGCSIIEGLTITGADITNLDSLDRVKVINGPLVIVDNPSLTDVSGLDNLKFLKGNLNISRNAILKEITGFGKLQSINVQAAFTNNPMLTTLGGFENFKNMYGSIDIFDNPLLTSLSALNSLKIIRGRGLFLRAGITIFNNDALKTLNDLSSLQRITGPDPLVLNISENDALLNVDGLQSLTFIKVVGADINISNNALLTSIDGLSNVAHFEITFQPSAFVTVTNNPMLTVCCSLLNLTSEEKPSVFTTSGNGPSCTYAEVAEPGGPCLPEELQAASRAIENEIAIYPNPGKGKFWLSFPGNTSGQFSVSIHNLSGNQKIKTQLTKGSAPLDFDLDLQNLPSGLYSVLVYEGGTLVTVKRIVVKD
jgi:hypothetical protein